MENKGNNFVYYNKNTGKVLSKEEAKAEWENARAEKRASMLGVNEAKNLIIENGFVKEKSITPVAELMAKSRAQKQEMANTTPLESLMPTSEEEKAKTREQIINDIIAEAHLYPSSNDAYSVDDILDEFGSKSSGKFIDVTDDVMGLKNPFDELNFNSSPQKPEIDIQDPDYALKILRDAKMKKCLAEYEALLSSSVSKRKNDYSDLPNPTYERTGKRKGVKYDFLIKSVVGLSIVAALFFGGRAIDKGIQTLSSEVTYSSAVNYIDDEFDDAVNFVNKNKISLPGSFDSYGHPMYWIDTESVAKDILDIPDRNYIAALYLAYDQMGNDRSNGDIHNWDNTIACIASLVDESRPNAYLTTEGCVNFRDFLIKAGFVDPDTHEPSEKMFQEAGRQAIVDFANYLKSEEPSTGGRL